MTTESPIDEPEADDGLSWGDIILGLLGTDQPELFEAACGAFFSADPAEREASARKFAEHAASLETGDPETETVP